jgi:hypothetical protein
MTTEEMLASPEDGVERELMEGRLRARRTVLVHRPGAGPVLFNVRQEVSAEPHLPGLRIPVASIFSH